MNEKKKNISRKNFLSRVGTGVVGTSILLSGAAKAKSKEIEQIAAEQEGKVDLAITVNGTKHAMKIRPTMTLAELLRDELELTGTKVVCNQGECGGCTVVLNDQAVYSCQMLALDADGQNVVTVEGLLDGEKLHPLQEAFVEEDGLQCGFCTPGQIMAAYALLKNNPAPSKDDIRVGMSGNLCRCGAYAEIEKSVKTAAEKMK